MRSSGVWWNARDGSYADISPLKMRQPHRSKTSGTSFPVTESHETSVTQPRKPKNSEVRHVLKRRMANDIPPKDKCNVHIPGDNSSCVAWTSSLWKITYCKVQEAVSIYVWQDVAAESAVSVKACNSGWFILRLYSPMRYAWDITYNSDNGRCQAK